MEIPTVVESSAYRSFKARLIGGFALMIVMMAAILSWKIYSERGAGRAAAFAQTKSFAQAMSAHVASEMRVVDLSLIRSAEALGAMEQGALKDALRVRQALALSVGVADANFWIQFVDAQGAGVGASNSLSIAGVSYADRSYFKAAAARCDSGLHVGSPEIGRVSQRKLFFLSRAVCSLDGVPLGVVVALVDARMIGEVFSSALFQPTLSITLLHGDGKIIARAPLFDHAFGFDLTSSDLFRYWQAAPQGSYEGRSLVDRQTRVFSYRSVGALPLAVAVGVAVEPWTGTLVKDVEIAFVALLTVTAVLMFSGRSALRSFKRLELSDASQRELNSQLSEARDDMARTSKRARMIADSLPALIAYVDAGERYVFHNSYYRQALGVDADRMDGRTMREALGDELYLPISDKVKQALSGEHVTFERPMTSGLAAPYLKYDYTPDVDESGAVVGFYALIIDITESKQVEERLSALARVDGLTGLPNRNHLYERLEESLARSRRGGCPIACLYLDIDHFKSINDSLGHAGGDEVLRQFGKRLRSCVRETDLVARLAGDEFVIVLEGMSQPEAARAVAAKVVEAMRAPFVVELVELQVSTSVGVAVSSGDAEGVDEVLKKADGALYAAKRAGRSQYQ